VVRKGPEFEYISACCSTPARKPRAGQKESVKDAETGKMKDKPKGLGKWRCTACGKIAKVTPRKPSATQEPSNSQSVPQAVPAQTQEAPTGGGA
jgi:hypothetical protein